MIKVVIFLVSLTGAFLYSEDLFAWGPFMHLNLGLSVIDNLRILSGETARIIAANTGQFLYGCVGADIIQAKRMLKYMYNCHNWENGLKLLRSAKSNPLKAFAYGYLGHLAADIIAHNCFVPQKIIETFEKRGFKHFFWEIRFDAYMFDDRIDSALKEILNSSHREEDDLMNDLLRTAVFSFKTNKRIFSGLLVVQGLKKWRKSMQEIYTRNNFHIDPEEIKKYFNLSMDAMLSLLIDFKNSKYMKFDPTGNEQIAKARKFARELRKESRKIKDRDAVPELIEKIEQFKTNCLG